MGILKMGTGKGTKYLTTIWDTGSDQQVVNSVRTFNMRKPCFDDQTARHCYNFRDSLTYHRKKVMPKTISYGSGDTMVLEGEENMELFDGECQATGEFMELLTTNIPQIQEHDIDVVGGLAPGGHKFVNDEILTSKMGIKQFSFCFDRDTEKGSGYLIWNDDHTEGDVRFRGFAHMQTMAVTGEANYWSVSITGLALTDRAGGKSSAIATSCTGDKCNAIIDTGTSLITLDKSAVNHLETQINAWQDKSKLECNDESLNKFPSLTFELMGIKHQLDPQDYIMISDEPALKGDNVNPQQEEMIIGMLQRFPFLEPMFGDKITTKQKCVLMLTPPMEKDMYIMGMIYMRRYYTKFDKNTKSVLSQRHDGKCGPMSGFRQKLEMRRPQKLQKTRPSQWLFSDAYHRMRGATDMKSVHEGLNLRDKTLNDPANTVKNIFKKEDAQKNNNLISFKQGSFQQRLNAKAQEAAKNNEAFDSSMYSPEIEELVNALHT